MNIKRIIFWLSFVVILGLIIWGLIVAMNKPGINGNFALPREIDNTDHVIGTSTLPVTLIEYSDFQCPACGHYFPMVEKLINESSSTLRFVYRHFPLYPKPHKNALLASEATEAAGKQNNFWDMYRFLFVRQTDWEDATNTRAVFEGYAKELGLDVNRFKSDMASQEIGDRVLVDRDEGRKIGVNSTPTFFLNGKVITNPASYEEFKTIIDKATTDAIK